MINFDKQKDKWNQILRQRKYRPSLFGMSVHFDWKFLLFINLIIAIYILFFGLNLYSDINNIINSDFSDQIPSKNIEKIDIEKFNQILEKIENQTN